MAQCNHNHAPNMKSVNRAFVVGIALNALFVIIEAGWGFSTGSLSLLSDAGHNFGDVASLILALIAFKLNDIAPSERFTYGFRKSTVLVSLINTILLLVTIAIIGYEAFHRFGNPPELKGYTIAIVALIGIAINALTAMLFFKDKEHDLNIKGAYLHLAADALISLGVAVSGVIMAVTGWFWLDSIVSFAIITAIFIGTWGLLKESLTLSLGGVPKGIDIQNIRDSVLKTEGVLGFHHVHVWAISTTQVALTAHLVISESKCEDAYRILDAVKHRLEHLGISHSTLEIELDGDACGAQMCS